MKPRVSKRDRVQTAVKRRTPRTDELLRTPDSDSASFGVPSISC